MRASLVLLLGVSIAVSLEAASPLTFYLSDKNGATGAALPNTYAFPSTPQGNASSQILKVINTSTSTVQFSSIVVTTSASSTPQVSSGDFTVANLFSSSTMAPGSSTLFTLNFAPTETGFITGYMQFSYAIGQIGCAPSQCPITIATASILTGTATPPQLVLSYSTSAGTVVPQPSSSPILFENVPACSSSPIVFTLQNQTSFPAPAPSISLKKPDQLVVSAFVLDASSVPATIAANSSATFTVTLAPGQSTGNGNEFTATLVVGGTNNYQLQGSSTDPLQISYVDQAQVMANPQGTIQFDQFVDGVLKFTVLNPTTSPDAVTISGVSVTGTGFVISGAPTGSTTLQTNQSISFTITFSPTSPATYTGALSIGCRQFTLSGQSVASPLPTFTFQLSEPTLTSQQQVNLSIQFTSPSAIPAVGTLTMQFTPLAGLPNDPAIFFTATSGTMLNVSVAAGSQTATYQGQSSVTFQTGTTAGAIAFTVTFPNTAPYTQSFTIAPATIQITSAQAVRQNPNLVVTVNGYDNTYSAGALSFVFYDLKGNAITTIPVNASSNFHQCFFSDCQAGGAFALQASFPVTGDVTQVGSVAATLTNSIGQTSTTQTFQ